MILKIYCYKDVKLGVFEKPFYALQDCDDFKELMVRGLRSETSTEKLLKYRDLALYFLGTFDDKVGLIKTVAPTLLMQLDEVASQVLKEVESNG